MLVHNLISQFHLFYKTNIHNFTFLFVSFQCMAELGYLYFNMVCVKGRDTCGLQ